MNFGQRGTFNIVKKKEGIIKLFDSFRTEFGVYNKSNTIKNYTIEKYQVSDFVCVSDRYEAQKEFKAVKDYEVMKNGVCDVIKTTDEFTYTGKSEVSVS